MERAKNGRSRPGNHRPALSLRLALVRILGSAIHPWTALMTAADREVVSGGAARAPVVYDQAIGDEAVFLQELAHQFQRAMLVLLGLGQNVGDLCLAITIPSTLRGVVSNKRSDGTFTVQGSYESLVSRNERCTPVDQCRIE
jgi:hypothetical protein